MTHPTIRLALDTSTPVASVALAVDDRLHERAETVSTFSERLMALVDEVFVEANIKPQQLQVVVCGAGPGSFTGLRIGLSTAKGLCLGIGCRLQMVSSLAALSLRAPRDATVLTALDAFRGEVYAAVYRGGATLTAPFSALPEALAVDVTYAVGDAFEKHPRAIPAHATVLTATPRARELLELAALRTDFDDPRTAAPTYVRASAPEEAASKRP